MKKFTILSLLVIVTCCSVFSQKNKDSKASLDAAFRPSTNTIVAGECIDFFDESTGGPIFWRWSFPGSEYTSTSDVQNPKSICYFTPGLYTVILEVQNGESVDYEECIQCIEVTENVDIPIANFVANYRMIPVGQAVTFTNLSFNGNFESYNWTFEEGMPNTSNRENPLPVTYHNVGTFDVELRIGDDQGDFHVRKFVDYIKVIPAANVPPVANFSADKVYVAPGERVNFTDFSRNYPYIWKWNFPGAVTPTSDLQNPYNITYAMPGTYDVELIVRNNLGVDTILKEDYIVVSNTDPCFANPDLTPIADFSASQRLIRSGTRVYFNDLSQNSPTLWTWSFEGGLPNLATTSNITHGVEYNRAGFYEVSLTVSNECMRSSTARKTDYIMVFSDPVSIYCDTIGNVMQGENLESPAVSGSWGQVGGHNGEKTMAYAEKITQYSFTQVNEIVISVYEAIDRQRRNSNVTFCIWDGSTNYPDSLLGEKTIKISEFTRNHVNTVTFDEPIEVNGPFFIGYKINYATGSNTQANNDQFAVHLVRRGASGNNTLYVQDADETWRTVRNKFGFAASSYMFPRSCVIDVKTNPYNDNIEVYPNPARDIVNISTGEISDGKNVLIQFIDITGRILSTERKKIDGQNIEINVNNYPEGLYFINMIIDQFRVTRKVMIAR